MARSRNRPSRATLDRQSPDAPVRAQTVVSSLFPADRLQDLVERFLGGLRRTVRNNLVVLVEAFLALTAGLRSGNGELTLAAVARAFPLAGNFKTRYKRLNRFLDNKLFDPQGLTEGLFRLLLGTVAQRGILPVLLDQSTLGRAELLLAGLSIAGRILPLSLMTFTYENIRSRPEREKSQNFIEQVFFTRLIEAAPPGVKLCFILDRGYARARLILDLLQQEVCFILRGRRNVKVRWVQGNREIECHLGKLSARHRQPRRIERIQYRSDRVVELDLVIYHEAGFKEPWYLLLPAGSAETFPTEQVVDIYRSRMHIEQGFRDFKTHLGIRGLRLAVRVAERTERLLMAFTIAYALVVTAGMTPEAQQARVHLEDSRPSSRHGTARILSARTVAALLLDGLCVEPLPRFAKAVARLLARALGGAGLYHLALRL